MIITEDNESQPNESISNRQLGAFEDLPKCESRLGEIAVSVGFYKSSPAALLLFIHMHRFISSCTSLFIAFFISFILTMLA